MIPVTLAFSGDQHSHLKSFLFPGDELEAVAILLCSCRAGDRRHRLTVREIHDIPFDQCERTPHKITWNTDAMVHILERATALRLSVVKVHSHPGGYPQFSDVDDEGDARLLPMIRGWVEADVLHGSVVMLPGGEMFGRVLQRNGNLREIEAITIAGDDLQFWYPNRGTQSQPSFTASHAQAFDDGTIERMQRMSFAVIGASGTGSPIVEQLARLGAGEIVSVDYDIVEERNINRILNSTMDDARAGRAKVDVLADAVERMGLGTKVIRLKKSLWDPEVIRAVAQCDVVFGCMDTVDGRYLLNVLATQYLIPYFDIGVRLDTVRVGPRKGQISEACGTINYLQPGRSSLMSRELFSMEDVAASGLIRRDPDAHKRQVKDGYIRGIAGHRPAVISVNMLGSALAVNEFLARLHPYRESANSVHSAVTFSLASMELFSEPEAGICPVLARRIGLGDSDPLLGQIELTERC